MPVMYKSRKKKAYTKFSVSIKAKAPESYPSSSNYAKKRTSSGTTSNVYVTVSDVDLPARTVDMSTDNNYYIYNTYPYGSASSTWNDGTTTSATRSYTEISQCRLRTIQNSELEIHITVRVRAEVGSTSDKKTYSPFITIPYSQLNGYRNTFTVTNTSSLSATAKYNGTTVARASLVNSTLAFEITITGIE